MAAVGARIKKAPKKLFKYRGFDLRTLQALVSREVYYSNPRQFNDPFDCAPTLDPDVTTNDLIKLCKILLRKSLEGTGEVEEKVAQEVQTLEYYATEPGEADDQTTLERARRYIFTDKIQTLFRASMERAGVLSLSATWRCPLLWAHYGDEHRGICLEYDTAGYAHPNLFQLRYRGVGHIKASDLLAWKADNSTHARRRVVRTYFLSKSKPWKYEQEWRDLIDKCGPHDPNMELTAVYLGARCDDAAERVNDFETFGV
jgi:hypothetical protein